MTWCPGKTSPFVMKRCLLGFASSGIGRPIISPIESPSSLAAPELASRQQRLSSAIMIGTCWCETTARSNSSSSFRLSLTRQLLVSCSEATECIASPSPRRSRKPCGLRDRREAREWSRKQRRAEIGGRLHLNIDSRNHSEKLIAFGHSTLYGQSLIP